MNAREKAVHDLNELCAGFAAAAAQDNGDAYDDLLVKVRRALPVPHREQLEQLINNGPVHDGDVISKADRGDLIRWGLATRVMFKGQWGYTAATYRGGHVLSERIADVARSQMKAV